MSIVRMKKLQLIAVRSQKDELLQALLLLGCVQLREPEGMLADPDTAGLLRAEPTTLVDDRARADELAAGLRLLDQYAPVKSGMFPRRPEVERSAVLDESALQADLALARRIRQTDEKIRAIAAEQSAKRAAVESLRPWAALDYPVECPSTKTCAAAFGSLPAAVPLDQAADALEAAVPEAQLIHVSSDDVQHCVLLISFRELMAEAMDSLRGFGLSQITFPDMTGTPKKNIAALEEKLRELSARKKELTARIQAEASGREELKLGVDRMTQVVARAEAAERLRCTDSIAAVEGWCPETSVEKLAATMTLFDCAWELSDPLPEEYPQVPVQLKNNRFTRPLSMVTNMYSLPAYDGVDPNPLMAPFFILFYGLMLADMGYGLLMILAALIIIKRARPKAGTRDFFELMLECGVSTFVMGALTGGFFGDAPYQFVHMLNESSTWPGLPSLFSPLNDTIYVLVGAMALGVVQILTGMTVSFVQKVKTGEGLEAVFNEGAWWLIYAGVALLALKIGNVGGIPVVLFLGVLLLLVGQFVMKKSVMGGLIGFFSAVYNGVTGIFGDILSYTRIMALMLAGSVIAQVFNTLAAMIGAGWQTPLKLVVGIVGFLLIFLFGNALNFALNLLGCYVHDLRLQCLEFFGKFYKDGGKPFRPLKVNTKYVDIIKEDH